MKKFRQRNTQRPKNVTKNVESRKTETRQSRYSQKINDNIGKAIGFRIKTEAALIIIICLVWLIQIYFAVTMNNPHILAPEIIVPQVTPEIPQVSTVTQWALSVMRIKV